MRIMYRKNLSIQQRRGDSGGIMVFRTWREARRFARIGFGYALLVLGVVAIPTPVPGVLLIVLGLSALETEADWARGLLERVKEAPLRWRAAIDAWRATRQA
jgi:hypothetical protein